MGWLIKEKGGPAWKHGWGDQTVVSLSPPPAPLVVLFLIIPVPLWMSLSVEYNRQVHRSMVGLKMLLLLLPGLLFILVRWVSINEGRFVVLPLPRAEQDSVHQASSPPWGVAILLALLLVLLYYQSRFHVKWSPWRSY